MGCSAGSDSFYLQSRESNFIELLVTNQTQLII